MNARSQLKSLNYWTYVDRIYTKHIFFGLTYYEREKFVWKSLKINPSFG